MPDDNPNFDIEIVRTAYAEKVREAFIVFVDNISVGQAERSCRERFLRAIELAKKALEMATAALSGGEGSAGEAEEVAAKSTTAEEALSDEDQALVDSVLAGTTGARRPPPTPGRFGKS